MPQVMGHQQNKQIDINVLLTRSFQRMEKCGRINKLAEKKLNNEKGYMLKCQEHVEKVVDKQVEAVVDEITHYDLLKSKQVRPLVVVDSVIQIPKIKRHKEKVSEEQPKEIKEKPGNIQGKQNELIAFK
ncbi:unnamed protein product [Dimorphilus gyrociliatus]|uniref:Uncharacterized protein n=1 Tax=Dimorphilus gyrociliatus TaxID=2664684 RepID=A0A7I8W5P9_9ANNE|nr:unnamed protein product [Dimorphilus gyrociliatus]